MGDLYILDKENLHLKHKSIKNLMNSSISKILEEKFEGNSNSVIINFNMGHKISAEYLIFKTEILNN